MEKKTNFRFTIFGKLWLAILLAALIPLGAVWYVARAEILQNINSGITQQLSAQAQRLSAYVDNWIDMNRRAMAENANLAGIISMDPAQQNPILQSMHATYDWTNIAFTIAPNGNNIGRSDTLAPKFYGDRGYFQQVMAGKLFVNQIVMGRTALEPELIFARPIYDSNTKIIGALCMAMPLVDLTNTISTLKIGKTGYAYLLDHQGNVIINQKVDLAKSSADFSKSPVFIGNGGAPTKLVTFMNQGIKEIAFSQRTVDGWDIVVQQNYDEAYAPLAAADRNGLILLAVSLVFATVLAYFLSRILSQPIVQLTKIADEISKGHLGSKIPGTGRTDEIGALAKAIDRMGISIQLAMKRLRQQPQ